MITYGQTVRWNSFDGTVNAVTVEDRESPQEALAEAVKSAKALGWTPPQWWQWWRWSEVVR